MLMAIDRRKKMLKNLRLVNYDAFENVCQQLGITYTFPPEYYRRITRRWLAKKALCIKVVNTWQFMLLCILWLWIFKCLFTWCKLTEKIFHIGFICIFSGLSRGAETKS